MSRLWLAMTPDEFIALGPTKKQTVQPFHLPGLGQLAIPLSTNGTMMGAFRAAKLLGQRLGPNPVRLQVDVDDTPQAGNIAALIALEIGNPSMGMIAAYTKPIPRSQWVKAVLGPDGDDDPRMTMWFRGEPKVD